MIDVSLTYVFFIMSITIKIFREDSSEEIDRLFFRRHYLARKDQSIVLFLEYWKYFAFNSFFGEFLWDRASGYNRHLTSTCRSIA